MDATVKQSTGRPGSDSLSAKLCSKKIKHTHTCIPCTVTFKVKYKFPIDSCPQMLPYGHTLKEVPVYFLRQIQTVNTVNADEIFLDQCCINPPPIRCTLLQYMYYMKPTLLKTLQISFEDHIPPLSNMNHCYMNSFFVCLSVYPLSVCLPPLSLH